MILKQLFIISAITNYMWEVNEIIITSQQQESDVNNPCYSKHSEDIKDIFTYKDMLWLTYKSSEAQAQIGQIYINVAWL